MKEKVYMCTSCKQYKSLSPLSECEECKEYKFEINRLAEIGRATEEAFIYFSMGQPSDDGTIIELEILNVEDLLEWYRKENNHNSFEGDVEEGEK